MFQTVSGSLNQALAVRKNEVLLIRGGTSSIGMLACQLAKHLGLKVIATTRKPEKEEYLKANGADFVIIDNGIIKEQVKNLFPGGVDKVLELIGTRTLKDSLKCIKPGGIVCMTGILGSEWTMKEFTPMGDIFPLSIITRSAPFAFRYSSFSDFLVVEITLSQGVLPVDMPTHSIPCCLISFY